MYIVTEVICSANAFEAAAEENQSATFFQMKSLIQNKISANRCNNFHAKRLFKIRLTFSTTVEYVLH